MPGARKRRRGQRGQVLVEFTIVGLAFFLFLFGVFDMARMLESWITVQHAAREAARYAITGRTDYQFSGTTVCDTRADCIVWTAKHGTTGLYQGGDGSTAVTVEYRAWDYTGGTPTGPTEGDMGKPCDQIEVEVRYTHHFATPILQAIVPGGITLKGTQRMTNEPFGSCKASDGTS
jgi:hypothetical protein